MNDLIVAEKLAEWQRLKALVLDSVSSPITRRVYNMALDEFIAWYRLRLHQGHGQHVASVAGGPRSRFLVDHYPDVSYSWSKVRQANIDRLMFAHFATATATIPVTNFLTQKNGGRKL